MSGNTAGDSNLFRERMKVRYSDTDAQGHLYFANYMVFADEVATSYMSDLGFDWSDPRDTPCLVFTANINCDYLGECRCGEQLRIEVAYARLGNSSARIDFALFREADDTVLARGAISQVFVSRETRRPIAIPDAIRAAITARHPHLGEDAARS
jgi:acyl-CoA thioester hydrolase